MKIYEVAYEVRSFGLSTVATRLVVADSEADALHILRLGLESRKKWLERIIDLWVIREMEKEQTL